MQAQQGIKTYEVAGEWKGVLRLPASRLHLTFHLTKGEPYTATFDVQEQSAKGIPFGTVSVRKSRVFLRKDELDMEFDGIYDEYADTLGGMFRQRGYARRISFRRPGQEVEETELFKRPQEPKPPFPYYSEDLSFTHPEGHLLSGTLVLPSKSGKYPVAIILNGSGPQDRNSELLGHKPALVLADYLARQGIGSLRYDDRGTYKSTGNFAKATSLDFASDAQAAVAFLKGRKEVKDIGLIGHSEGGLLAQMVAAQDSTIGFMVLLAAPGTPCHMLLAAQQDTISKLMGEQPSRIKMVQSMTRRATDFAYARMALDTAYDRLKNHFHAQLRSLPKEERYKINDDLTALLEVFVKPFVTPWMQEFLRTTPATYLRQVRKTPVLALNGEKDLQVLSQQNLESIRAALIEAGNPQFEIHAVPELNHLFQHARTGLPAEYAEIEETFSVEVLDQISKWITKVGQDQSKR